MTSVESLPDAAARERIRTDHGTTLIVEAAAGTGKTTEVVRRIVELIAVGRAEVRQIAAITFTQRAGGELRLRIRQGIETRIEAERASGGDPAARVQLEQALAQIEEASIGTIHTFCATLLREHPVEAGVDPDFEVLADRDRRIFFDRVFQQFAVEQLASPEPGVARLLRCSRNPKESPLDLLREAGSRLLDHRHLDAPWTRKPWNRQVEIERLLGEDLEISRDDPRSGTPKTGTVPSLSSLEALYRKFRDPPGARTNWLVASMAEAADLMREIRLREAAGVGDPDWTEQALASLRMKRHRGFVPTGAPADLREQRDAFGDRLDHFREQSRADLAALLREDLRGLVALYEERKRKAGLLDFDDLLLFVRGLLRANAALRAELRGRFRQILVDEYQDTDPLQTEILLLLTAQDPPGGDWTEAVPIPGRLCLVGDPKQSIYRFRRADVRHYLEVKKHLLRSGGAEVRLTTNFRSVPVLCTFVNEVMEPVFRQAEGVRPLARQVDYSRLQPFRSPLPGSAPLAPIPLSSEYLRNLEQEEPAAVAKFVEQLLESGFEVTDRESGAVRPVEPSDICMLFRRFRSYRKLVPQRYAEGLVERGIPHALGAVRSYIGSAELVSLRAALTAIEFPDDELSVYAALRGPLFSIPDQDLFLFREGRGGRLRPSDAAQLELGDDASDADRAIREALRFLFRLHRQRNHLPIAITLQALLSENRAESAFAFWKSPDQVFSNLRRLTEAARAFEARGGLSFRGFVEQLDAEVENPGFGPSQAMDEDVSGVRMMTIHSAKGLEFPVVILCDAAHTRNARAQRIVRPERNLHACDLGDRLFPWDLLEGADREEAEGLAEEDRMLYVAMTRARDLLAAPVFDLRFENDSMLRPVSRGLSRFRESSERNTDPTGWSRRSAAKWEILKAAGNETAAKEGEQAERGFLARRRLALETGRIPRRRTTKAAVFVAETASEEHDAAAGELHILSRDPDCPSGAGFGNLVRQVLDRVDFSAPAEAVQLEAERSAGELDLPGEFAASAAKTVLAALRHPLIEAAREAAVCYRELPLLHLEEAAPGVFAGRAAIPTGPFLAVSALDADGADGAGEGAAVLVEGVADLVFRAAAAEPWTVVDIRTDGFGPEDPVTRETVKCWQRLVALSARAVSRATGDPAKAALLLV